MKAVRIVLYVVSIPLFVFGLIWLIAAEYAAMRALVGIMMWAAAGAMIYAATYMIKEPPPLGDYESRIVSLARQRKGKLTVPDVVVELRIPSDKARAILNLMARKNACVADIETKGDITVETYTFPT